MVKTDNSEKTRYRKKEYVRKNIKIGKGNNGAAGISKKLGVNIKVINEYTKTLT